MFAPDAELPIAFAQADLGLPADVLERLWELFQTELQVPAHFGRGAIRPGPFDQGPTGMGIPGLRDAPLATAPPLEYSEGVRPREFMSWRGLAKRVRSPSAATVVTATVTLHATEGLECFYYWAEPPGFDVLVECLFKPLEPFGVFGDRPNICLEDDVLRGSGTDNLAEPAQVRRAPGGSACIPDIMPEQKGFEAKLGRLQIVECLFTRTAQVTNGFVFNLGDRDRREIP